MKTHYDILKVAKDAPLDDIRSAYKKLAIKYHPDRIAYQMRLATRGRIGFSPTHE